MPLPDGVTLVDLRSEALREAEPLEGLTERPVLVVSLDEIETGGHSLTPAQGPLVVICERGVRSGLAAQYLRADGLDAQAYPGGVPAFRTNR